MPTLFRTPTHRSPRSNQATSLLLAVVIAVPTAALGAAVAAAGAAGPTQKVAVKPDKAAFAIGGAVTEAMGPGSQRRIDLVLTNPNSFDVLARVDVAVAEDTTAGGAPNPGCSGAENLVVVQGLRGTVTLPRKATRSLSDLGVAEADWPLVQMANLTTNQYASKGSTFTLVYSGSAVKR